MIKFNWLMFLMLLQSAIIFTAKATKDQEIHTSSVCCNNDCDAITLEAQRLELKRLETLDTEEKEDKQKIARMWDAVGLGTLAILLGYCTENRNIILTGCAAVALSGARISYLHQANDHNAWKRKEERDMIQKRLHMHRHLRKT